jgi:UDP-N-acetylglucosamine:LPS N-acetylglucosamine transferase
MNTKKQKKKLKKIKVAFFISDVGFGHMVRQREIINLLLSKIKNIKITIVNGLHIEILRETFGNKVNYIKKFNNIELLKTKNGFFDKKKTLKTLDIWNDNLDSDLLFFKKNFIDFNFIISDFVPQVFYYSKIFKINCYGICHFTWSWYFKKVYSNKKKLIISKINKYENLAKKIFFPPFTPDGVYKNFPRRDIFKKVNFIIRSYKNVNFDNKKKTILIMDSGTRTLSNLISETIPYIQKMKKFNFYIGISSLNSKAVQLILKSNNILPVANLKGMYSYIEKVDYVIVRGGFNSITECLFFKKPSIFMNEKFNPEVEENLKLVSIHKFGATMTQKDWNSNFSKRIEFFIKNEVKLIRQNLKNYKFNNNGAEQILKFILKDNSL